MEFFIFTFFGLLTGALLGWLLAKISASKKSNSLEKDLSASKMESYVRMEAADKVISEKVSDINTLKAELNLLSEMFFPLH